MRAELCFIIAWETGPGFGYHVTNIVDSFGNALHFPLNPNMSRKDFGIVAPTNCPSWRLDFTLKVN
jgi:hypothetical protein